MEETCCYNVRVTDDLGTPLAAVKIVGFHKELIKKESKKI